MASSPDTKVERCSVDFWGADFVDDCAPAIEALRPLVPEKSFDDKAYIRWREDAVETVRR